MIQKQGLGHFYDLREGISQPVNAPALPPDAFAWLQPLVEQAEAEARAKGSAIAGLTLPLEGIHCVGCRWLIGELFARQPGGATCQTQTDATAGWIHFSWHVLPKAGGDASAAPLPEGGRDNAAVATNAPEPQASSLEAPAVPTNAIAGLAGNAKQPTKPAINAQQPATEVARVNASQFDPLAFATTLFAFGYTLVNPALPRRRPASSSGRVSPGSTRKRLATRLLLCGVFAINAIVFSLPVRLGASAEAFPLLRLFGLLVFLCATLCVGLAASYFFQTHPLASPGTDSPTGRSRKKIMQQGVGVLLLAAYTASLAEQSLGLPAIFAPDAVAGLSFVALLVAFARS